MFERAGKRVMLGSRRRQGSARRSERALRDVAGFSCGRASLLGLEAACFGLGECLHCRLCLCFGCIASAQLFSAVAERRLLLG
jgi:hypothetical protein